MKEDVPETDWRSTSSLTDSASMDARLLNGITEDDDDDDEDEDENEDDDEDSLLTKARNFDGSEGFVGIPRSFDEANKNVRLEEHIKLHHLEQLMQEFSQHSPPDILIQEGSGYFPAKVKKRTAGQMNLEEFKDAVFRVLGTDEYEEYLEKLFMKLDTSCDGYVDWNEFCTYLLLLYRENDYLRTKRDIPFLVEPKIRHIVHNRQETTTKIVALHGPMRYVTISREGAMTVFQPNLVMEKQYMVPDQDDEQKRRFKMWVTDAIYMKNCQKIAIGSTSRDIRFYDVSSSQYFEEYHLFAMSDVPYCFDYYYDPQNSNSESILVFGVDSGAIHLFTFLRPVTQLFETPFKHQGGVQKIFMQEIENHSQWVKHLVLPEIHPEIIRQVRYLSDNRAIISASACPKNTVVISDVLGVKKSYVFKMEKGVECFDHSKDMNLLVTGSGDHLVRLWNPYVTNKPVAILTGHHTGVIGVAIHEGFKQVFSYAKDAIIKVWDTKEHTCLQTIILKFPSSIHGRMPEHGQFPVHLQDGKNSAFIVTCNDYIGCLRLGRVEEKEDSSLEVTHTTQLCSAIYNKFLKQVVTGCDSSTIAVWDIETGNKSIVFSNAHGDEEITCMAFDATNRRLISGARNGTVKVWNFQNGHNLHKLEPVGEAEVTGILQLPDKKVILTVGWNQKIVTYDDKDADNLYIPANTSWKGGQPHQDDILTTDFAPPNFLATAGFDGEIVVWEVDTEKIYVRLRKGQPPNISKKLEALKTKVPGMPESSSSSRSNSRPNSRHRSSHKVARGQAAPVDKLLFLKARASIRFTESAILISSEGGVLRWWNIYSQHKEMVYNKVISGFSALGQERSLQISKRIRYLLCYQPPSLVKGGSKKLEALKTKVPGMPESSSSSRSNSRPNSRHRSSHKVARGQAAPVDKLLFLKARASIRFTESAILISSEGGVLRWWNIYSQHKEMGWFYAPSIPDESVLAMCSKPNDGLLITGDTQGMVRCWDIMDYCTKNDGCITRSLPPLEAVWKAHDSAVVSVEYIQHDAGTFILTASTDKTARLWSPDGQYIGTFGQKEPWNLKTPSTWGHPKTPWSKDEEKNTPDNPKENGTQSPHHEGETVNITINGTQPSERELTNISSATPGLGSRENSNCYPSTMPPSATSRSLILHRDASTALTTASVTSDHFPQNYRMNYRSQTFAFGFHRSERSKTFLGIKVEQDLERRQKCRRGRRVQFGEISIQSTSRHGKQCSPYHALTTPDWKEIQLPEEMPLSKRMLDRGYTGRNLTVEYIKAMDFSYGIPETPASTASIPHKPQTSNSSRGLTPGHLLSSASSRREKSARLPPIRSGRTRLLPASPKLRKSSTIL
ncbi:WD repeat-containing protein on y chromosome-like isoform x1 [Plakobranchus ocellatus]|uniref:WD repeat-containing protein on y chromosome-like isoform x1 n=1 Tax=Plakobranchus ocellatus TaxID=259542 RepID=A0AAV4D2I2_9GAST|nr:WD repeat-containing protein on y chromosome-like isoform x1 [Plakobranchus ocellatus]